MENNLRFSNEITTSKKISQICDFNSKSKMPASSGKEYGKYRFFKSDTSDNVFYSDDYITDGNTIIINDGGIFNVKYFEGKAGYSDHCIGFHTKEDFLEKYIYYILMAKSSYINQYGFIGGTLKNIDRTWFNDYQINVHQYCDQKLISKFLTNIDSILIEKKQQLSKTKLYKASMLSKMFPKEDSLVPEIRFKGFDGEWSRDVFGDKFEKLSNNSFSRDLLNYKNGDFKNIHYGDILIKYGFSINVNSIDVPYVNKDVEVNQKANDFLKSGDVVFADTAEDTTAGKMVEIVNPDNLKVISGLHTYPCRPLMSFAPGYLGIMLNTSYFHNQLIPYMQGTKVTGFNYNYLCKINIVYPTIEEQYKIVSFFTNLDDMISNQEKEIETLEHLKKTLLNKMFA